MNSDIKSKSLATSQTYLVDITIGNFYQLEINASSREDALAKAQALLEQAKFEDLADAQPYITEWNCEPV